MARTGAARSSAKIRRLTRSSRVSTSARVALHTARPPPASSLHASADRCSPCPFSKRDCWIGRRPFAGRGTGSPATICSPPETSETWCPCETAGSQVPAGARAMTASLPLPATSTTSPSSERPARWPLLISFSATEAAASSRLPSGACRASDNDITASTPGVAPAMADRDAWLSATRRMAVSTVSARPVTRPARASASACSVSNRFWSARWCSSQAFRPMAAASRKTVAATVHFRRVETASDTGSEACFNWDFLSASTNG